MKKGITVVSVSILVVVIIILLGTVTVSSYNSIQNAKKITFSLEIANIQEKVDRYMKNAEEGDYPVSTNSYTISLSNISDNDNVKKQFDGETIDPNNEVTLYELDLSALGIEDNQYGNEDTEKDVYVLSKETNKVYYLEGVKVKDMTYYTLTEELIDINKRNEKKSGTETNVPLAIKSDNVLTIKNISQTNKEIYLANIKSEGSNVTAFKYELGIIEQSNAKDYFKNNGKSIIGDRIKLQVESDITLYLENSKGDFVIKHIEMKEPPTLATSDTWYKGTIKKNTITEINIANSYTPTGNETESWDASEAQDGSVMCYINGTTLTIAGNDSGKIIANANSSTLFCFTNVTSISGLSILDTSNVTDMSMMFSGCTKLTAIDLSKFNTGKVTTMYAMFNNCQALTFLDVSSFDTSNVTNMSYMFASLTKLGRIDVSNFNTRNVTNMDYMFVQSPIGTFVFGENFIISYACEWMFNWHGSNQSGLSVLVTYIYGSNTSIGSYNFGRDYREAKYMS